MLRLALASTLIISVAPVLAPAQTPPASDPVTVPSPRAHDDPQARSDYFYRQRAYPFTRIPPGALQAARRSMSLMPRFNIVRSAAPGAPGASAPSTMSTWTSMGPAAIATSPTWSGRTTGIAVSPVSSSTIYLGAAQGGIWKTTDGGASWTALTDQQCSLATGSITLDPVNPNIVYAGTGEENFSGDSYYGCGILRSLDGGATWATLGESVFQTTTGGARIGKVLVDSATAGGTNGVIYAATSFGLYKSGDGGTSWSNILTKGFGYVTDLIATPGPDPTLFAAATSAFASVDNGIYRSGDAGATWTRVGGGLPASNVGRIALAISHANPGVMYAAIEDPTTSNLLGLYRSVDGGATWTTRPASGVNCSAQCWYAMVVTASPTDPNTVFFSGLSLYKSTDGGATFTDVGSKPGGAIHVDQHALMFDPQNPLVVYAGTDGGIFKSSDGTANWVSINANLAITQFYSGISVTPNTTFPVLGGAQDNGTLESDGAITWPQIVGGDGGYTAMNPAVPTTRYAETQWTASSGFSGPRRRTAANPTYNLITAGINSSDPASFIPPLVIDPAHPSRLYFGTNKLYRTLNGGDSWTAMSPAFPSGNITAIGVTQADTQVVYAGTGTGSVQVTADGGANWAPVITGLPARAITAFATNLADSRIAYVTCSGFGAGHVFKTINRGANWTDASGNLPNVPVNAIVQIPGGELFIGTDLGVFRSADDGTTWTQASTGFPNVAVFGLAYNFPTQTLVAATHGRGMWSATVTPVITATQLVAPRAVPTGASGVALATLPPITVRDVTGLVVPGATNTITASIAGGGTLSGTTSVAAVNGIATFSNLVVNGFGLEALTFTSSGLASVTDTAAINVPVTIAAAPASHRDTIFVGAPRGDPDSATVTIGSGAAVRWTATRAHPWTSLVTTAGTGTGAVRWTRLPTGLSAGVHVDTITISVPGSGVSTRIVDSLVVRAVTGAFASFSPDSAQGPSGTRLSLDLMMDLSAIAGTALGSYSTDILWDSTIVRADSVRAVSGGYAAPTVTVIDAGHIHLAAADATSTAGVDALARLYFEIVANAEGSRALISPAFTGLTSTTGVNLLTALGVRAGVVGVPATVLRGDVNGDGQLTAADAQAILMAVVGLPLPSGFTAMPNGDANCNGKLEALDAQLVLNAAVGLPTGSACVGTVH